MSSAVVDFSRRHFPSEGNPGSICSPNRTVVPPVPNTWAHLMAPDTVTDSQALQDSSQHWSQEICRMTGVDALQAASRETNMLAAELHQGAVTVIHLSEHFVGLKDQATTLVNPSKPPAEDSSQPSVEASFMPTNRRAKVRPVRDSVCKVACGANNKVSQVIQTEINKTQRGIDIGSSVFDTFFTNTSNDSRVSRRQFAEFPPCCSVVWPF